MLPLASPPMVPKPQLQEPQFAFLPTTHTRSPTGPLSVVKSHRHLHPPKLRHPVRAPPPTRARASALLQKQHPCPYPSPLGDPNIQSPQTGLPDSGSSERTPSGIHQRPPPGSPSTCREKKSGLVARERAPVDKELLPGPDPSPSTVSKASDPPVPPAHIALAHLRLWPRAAPRRVAWGGAGPEQLWRGAARRQGEGAAGDSARGAWPRPRPSAAGRESPGCACSRSIPSRERAEGG